MAAQVTYEGLTAIGTIMWEWQQGIGRDFRVRLFQTALVLSTATTLADILAAEATFDGYAAQVWPGITDGFDVTTDEGFLTATSLTFTMTGSTTPNTVYGYAVTCTDGPGTERLLWCDLFPTPFAMIGAWQLDHHHAHAWFRHLTRLRGEANMAGKITDIGEYQILNLGLANLGDLTVHLVQAYFTELDAMTPADFTEATYPGYAPLGLVYAGMEALAPGGKQVGDYATLVFTCVSNALPNLIYGYYVEDALGNVLLVEAFAGHSTDEHQRGNRLDPNLNPGMVAGLAGVWRFFFLPLSLQSIDGFFQVRSRQVLIPFGCARACVSHQFGENTQRYTVGCSVGRGGVPHGVRDYHFAAFVCVHAQSCTQATHPQRSAFAVHGLPLLFLKITPLQLALPPASRTSRRSRRRLMNTTRGAAASRRCLRPLYSHSSKYASPVVTQPGPTRTSMSHTSSFPNARPESLAGGRCFHAKRSARGVDTDRQHEECVQAPGVTTLACVRLDGDA